MGGTTIIMHKKKKQIGRKSLERVLDWLDDQLHYPLSTDDMLYARWEIERRKFSMDVSKMRERLFEEWCDSYLVQYKDGVYERGKLLKRMNK
jgi:hypothetical protein